MTTELFKNLLIIIIAIFLFGIVFNLLFKVGLILLLALGILYLFKKVFAE